MKFSWLKNLFLLIFTDLRSNATSTGGKSDRKKDDEKVALLKKEEGNKLMN